MKFLELTTTGLWPVPVLPVVATVEVGAVAADAVVFVAAGATAVVLVGAGGDVGVASVPHALNNVLNVISTVNDKTFFFTLSSLESIKAWRHKLRIKGCPLVQSIHFALCYASVGGWIHREDIRQGSAKLSLIISGN